MSILLVGAEGQVGRELQKTLPRLETTFGPVVAVGRSQLDLTDLAAIAAKVEAIQPNLIVNAAAYTAVDKAESEPKIAHRINAEAPEALAKAAAKCGAALVHISTDYVFSGQEPSPRKEADEVGPLSMYGKTKLAGEEAIRQVLDRHVILRTAWVYGVYGKGNFVKTMLRLSDTRDALNVVDDQIGGPTPARSIAQAVLAITGALRGGQTGGTYHFAGAPVTSWAGFARETFARAGRDVTVTGIPTTDYPTPATRPLNSRLDCTTLETDFGIKPADWQAELAHILKVLT